MIEDGRVLEECNCLCAVAGVTHNRVEEAVDIGFKKSKHSGS